MILGETREAKERRHSREELQRLAGISLAALALVPFVVKYVPNNLHQPQEHGVSVVSDQSTNNQPGENPNIKFQP